jgi:beta-galactosidase
VGRKADALFFLQAARIDRRRDDREIREKKEHELARYLITYEDGVAIVVPIRAELDVKDYRTSAPDSLPGAQLGWSHKYPGRDETAGAYIQQWNNPRPEVAIRSVDLAYGDAPRRGVPALLALTAATADPTPPPNP